MSKQPFDGFDARFQPTKNERLKNLVKLNEGSTAGEAEETGVFMNIHTLLYLD